MFKHEKNQVFCFDDLKTQDLVPSRTGKKWKQLFLQQDDETLLLNPVGVMASYPVLSPDSPKDFSFIRSLILFVWLSAAAVGDLLVM